MNIDSRKRKKALLLHYAGDQVFEVYETLGLNNDDSKYDEVKRRLTEYFCQNEIKKSKNRNFATCDSKKMNL